MESEIRAFLNYLRVEKGLSANTLQAYRRDLAKFAAFATKRGLTLDQFTHSTVIDFLRTLYLRKLDSRTVARHLVTIRHLFRFAFTEGIIKEDPAANVAAPKFRRSLPEFLSVDEVDRLLRQPDVTSTLGLRDKAMIELLYSTGLRVSELCGLKAADIQIEAGCLSCIGKGNKERLVPVGRAALELVVQYMKKSRMEILGEKTSPYLFPSRTGTAINRIAFWKTSGRVRTQSGVAQAPHAAYAAAQFCHAPAGPRSRLALRANDVGPCGHCHHANLHARSRRTFEASL